MIVLCADLSDPVIQIIVVRYPANFAVFQFKEGPCWQDIFLAIGFRQTFIGHQILTVDEARLPSSLAIITMSVRVSL